MSSMAVFIALPHGGLHNQSGKHWTKPGSARPVMMIYLISRG